MTVRATGTDIGFPRLHRGDHRIEVHIFHLQRHAEHVGHSLHDVDVDTHDTPVVVILIGLERSVGGHDEPSVGSSDSLGLVGDAHLLTEMAADDGVERTIVAQQAQGMVDVSHKVTPSMRHTESIRLRAVGVGQDSQSVVLRHESLGRLFVLHHTVDLALQECLNGIGGLGEPLHLCTRLVVFHLRHLRVGGST